MSEQEPQDLYLQVGDIKTRYYEVGKSSSTVIFIHGLGSYIEHWENNIKSLSRHHHVIALDMVGCGLTEKPRVSYSIPYLAKFVDEFMGEKKITTASIVGHSLGGIIAFELTLRNPKVIDRLVLLAGGSFETKVAFELRILTVPIIGEWLLKPNRDKVERFLKLMFFNQDLLTNEFVEFAYHRFIQPGYVEAYLRILRSFTNFFGIKQELVHRTIVNANRITAPTLVAWGREDRILPVQHALIAMKRLPNANLHILENCGHMPQYECGEEFNELVLGFLNS